MAGQKGTLYSSIIYAKENGFLDNKNRSKETEKPIIISQLVLKDNIRASTVCRTWSEAGLYIRLVDKPPWLMYLPKRGNLFELYDPLKQKIDGWLLMRKTVSNKIIFFNPFTRTLINLPNCELSYDAIAFFCAPTSGTCLLLAFKHVQVWYDYGHKKKRIFLALRKGEFFTIITCGGEKSINLPWMRNSVYFPKLRFHCKCCVSYSFDEERYYPRKQWQEQEDLCPLENLWIRPPKTALDYM
ncbi:hypothetical protein N665_0202s0003 [Sinapis alba]|nr:hypothetical protein N665_0202s0003 [Sinapis alba]